MRDKKDGYCFQVKVLLLTLCRLLSNFSRGSNERQSAQVLLTLQKKLNGVTY